MFRKGQRLPSSTIPGKIMTLRELLMSLHAVDEKFLDMAAYVSPASGGYSPISHTSLLYVGHPVIHLEPKPASLAKSSSSFAMNAYQMPTEMSGFWSSPGDEVAAVNPDDLRNVLRLFREVQAHTPAGQCGSIDARMYKSVCSPSANVMAVWYRASMLGLLQMLPESPLTPWTHDGELDDPVFQVAATFPMKKMEVAVVRQGPPFDVQEFLKQIEKDMG
jgi:hypothetical protein